ncbi:MAG: hypothetical protein Q9174_004442 [Haloplaca sp. 1 TL-2023]
MSHSRIFPVFCTVDVPSKVLTTFLLHAHEPLVEGSLDDYSIQVIILRSPDLQAVTERTSIPTSGQIHSYLQLHAPNTEIYEDNFIILDARSLEDYTCEITDNTVVFSETRDMRAVGRELKTLRSTFRDSVMSLGNLEIANTDVEEMRGNLKGDGNVSMIGETEESRKRDLADAMLGERVLRDGKVVRD